MASNSKSLVLKLLADISDFKKGLDAGSKETMTFGEKVQDFGKKAGLAFAAAGAAAVAYAGKLAVDGVKAAIEDEAAQLRLAKSLKNVTGATDDQIKATEDYIAKTSIAFGVTDDQLRPSLDRLVRSTKNVEEAQKLQALALDISAGTGKSLIAVSEALGKAHDGNLGALKRLGVGLDDSIIKSKDFDAATAALSNTFRDQASQQADTFEGKMRRLQTAFNEGKETIGFYILEAITPIVTLIVEKVIPAIQDFTSNLGEKLAPIMKIIKPIIEGVYEAFNNVRDSVTENTDELQPFFNLIKAIGGFIANYLAPFLGEVLGGAFKVLGVIVGGVIDKFSSFISFLENIYNKIKRLIDLIQSAGSFVGGIFSNSSLSVPSTPTDSYMRSVGYGSTNITVNGAIDSESTARQIVTILNESQARGGAANSANWSFA